MGKIEQKTNCELRFDTDEYSILYLPKNSYYKNEYDEYLMFFIKEGYNDKVLLRRLQVTNLDDVECAKKIREINKPDNDYKENYTDFLLATLNDCENSFDLENHIRNREEIDDAFESFPEKFSAPVVLLQLQQPYNFSFLSEEGYVNSINYKNFFDVDYVTKNEQCFGIFFKNKNYILLQEEYINEYFGYDYYLNKEKTLDFIYHVYDEKIKKLKEENKNILGPFGTIWGMNKNDLFLVSNKNTKIEEVEPDSINYKDHYINYLRTKILKFIPEKSVDLISEYYAVIDESEGLYRVFTIVNFTQTAELKEMQNLSDKNKEKYENMKSKITKQYGKEKGTRENFILWITDENIRIDLFSECKIVKLYNWYSGKEYGGQQDYTCLVYTDKEKEAIVNKRRTEEINNLIKEKENVQEKKEKEQDEYF